jgi:hypothetical protein
MDLDDSLVPMPAGDHAAEDSLFSPQISDRQASSPDDIAWEQESKPLTNIVSLAEIERCIPPNILLQFISAYLVQAPTVLQVIHEYRNRTWGPEEHTTIKIFCSLSVCLLGLPAKRAAVKWAEKQLESVSSNPEASEYRRLVQSWHKALKKESTVDNAENRRERNSALIEQMKMNQKGKILKMRDKYDIGRNKEKERLEVLRKYTKGYPSLAFSGGKKIKVETVIKLGDIKSGKKKSLRGRTRATVALKMFFPNREDKKIYKRLERIRKFKSASNKVKQSLGAMAAFQLGSPKNSPPNSPPNSPETLLIPTSKNAGSKKTFPHPKPPAGSSNVLKIRSANVMNRLSNTKSS